MSARIAIVGTGWGVNVQLPAFRAAGLDVTALWGRTPEKAERIAADTGIPFATADFSALLERPDVDVVSIVTPPSTHADLAVSALEAGKHVLCEKPTAFDAGGARRMLEAAWAHPGQISMIDHELRFLPSRIKLCKLVRDGVVGTVLHAEATCLSGARLGSGFAWNWWSQRRHGGGILGAIGSHMTDALMSTLGRRIISVSACLSTLFPRRADSSGTLHDVDVDEHAVLQVRFEGGATGLVHVSFGVAGKSTHRLLVAGTHGCLVWEDDRLFLNHPDHEVEDLSVEDDPEAPEYKLGNEWRRATYRIGHGLRQALEHGDLYAVAPGATFEDGWWIQRVLDAARRSDEDEGRRIDV